MLRFLFCLLFGLGAPLAVSAQTLLDGNYPAEAQISFDEVHKLVSSEFNDPRSAQYKGLILRPAGNGGQFICGWVNSKNSAGGYDPFAPFFVLTDPLDYRYRPEFESDLLTWTLFNMAGCADALGLVRPVVSR